PISYAEIKAAAFQLGPSKAPGPDGYPGRFFQAHWDMVGNDLCAEIRAFFETSTVLHHWNDTFISLIAKVSHPESIGQFRPISVANFRMKVISKVLSNRLKPLLPNMVSELQAAFTGNRAIQDNVIVVHEVMHKLRIRKKGNNCDFVLKVDMLKAYDRVSCEFLFKTLEALGFNSVWIGWIRALVSTVRFAVLINGQPTPWFQPTRGLRQGDPLSPFLFILTSNILSFMIQKESDLGGIKGIRLNNNSHVLNHMLFADDTILFGKATIREAENIKNIMERYCTVSGQAINSEKSAIYFSQNTPDNQKQLVANCLRVPIDSSMGKYLGVPTDWGNTKTETFRYILDRLAARAQSWSSILLSHAGRETMIKAVLQAIPAYIFSCFKLLKVLIKKMDSILVNFWWTGDGNRRSLHWVAADEIRRAKKDGGLGFKSFADFNKAFLAKLAWRILIQPDSLWVRVLKGLYYPRSDFLIAGKHHRPSWVWSSIREGRDVLLQGIRKNIWNGMSTDLNDAWIPGIEGFRASVPEAVNCRVSDFIILPQRTWDIQKLRVFYNEDIVRQIITIPLGPTDFNDRWIWHYDQHGSFSVKSCYKMIRNQNPSGRGSNGR
ncbi:LINE-1 retrotransposable element ORF2 protein, partial [Linum perenne]